MIGANEIAVLIKEDQLSRMKSLMEPYSLEERQKIVAQKIRNLSPLFLAIKGKKNTIVKYLLDECGASVEDAGPCLSMAAYNKCNEIVELLLKKGSHIDSVGLEQRSALYYASSNGNMPLVKYLVDNGADVNIIDAEGNTPLMASMEYPNICRYLLQNDADPDRINNRGKTAVMMAVENEISHYSLFVLFSSGADMNFTNEFGENAVFLAAQKGFLHIVSLLKSFAVDIEPGLAKSHQLDSCYAHLRNEDTKAENYWRMNLNVLDLPITNQAYEINDTRFISSFEHILEHLNSRSRDVIRYLETRFGSKNPYTMRAIALAAYCMENITDSAKVFDLFIKELKSCSDQIFMQLIPCINTVCTKIIFHLNNDNVDDTVGVLNNTFVSYVNHLEHFSNIYHLINRSEQLSLSFAIEYYFNVILKLIKTILDFQPQNLTTLKNAVEKLLKMNLRGSGKDSILHFSIKDGYDMSIIELLLSCGADVKCRNEEYLTPLHCIIDTTNNSKLQIIEMFLRYDFDFKDYNDIDFCLACTFKKRRLLENPLKNTTLQCLAARAVHLNQDRILHTPRHLCNIINSHSFKRYISA